MKCPRVSVCVPTYNYGRFLPEAIDSILCQSFDDFELIIIDDCSQDDTREVLQRYAARDSRVIARVNERNKGMVVNWNACLQESRGTYIKFVFGDDFLCSSDALRIMVEYLEGDPSISLVASARNLVDEQSYVSSSLVTFPEDSIIAGAEVVNRCLKEFHNLVGEPTAVMFRRDQAMRGFDVRFRQIVDMEMWFHLLESGRFAYIKEPLVSFRVHDRQQTVKNLQDLVFFDDYMMLFKEYLPKTYINLKAAQKREMRFNFINTFYQLALKDPHQRQLVKDKIRNGYRRFYWEMMMYKLRDLVYILRNKLRNSLRRKILRLLRPELESIRDALSDLERDIKRQDNRISIMENLQKDSVVVVDNSARSSSFRSPGECGAEHKKIGPDGLPAVQSAVNDPNVKANRPADP